MRKGVHHRSASGARRAALPRRLGPAILALAAAAVLAGLGVIVSGASALPPCTDNFVATNNDFWSNAANWTTTGNAHTVPGSADVACWGAGATVDLDSGSQTASALEGGTLDTTGGTLTLGSSTSSTLTALDMTGGTLNVSSGTLAVSGEFQMPDAGSGAVLQGPGTMTVGGDFDLQSSDIESMAVTQNGTGTFAIDGSSSVSSQPIIGNSAVTTHTSGTVTLSNTSFNNTDSGASTITSTAEPIAIAAGNYNAAFDNDGGYTLSAPGFDISGNVELAPDRSS
jgi:hypothetical protein